MRGILRLLAATAALAVLAGCQSFPTQPFNQAAHAHKKSIALAPIGLQDKPNVYIVNSVGMNFGLIGGIVEASRQASAQSAADEFLKQAGFDFQAAVPIQIEQSLQGAGFVVSRLPGPRPQAERMSFLKVVPSETGSELALDVYVSFLGYVAAGATTEYRPAIHLNARLTDGNDGKVLFADQVYYNNFVAQTAKTAITLEPDAKYNFKDLDAMKASPQLVAEGLRSALEAASAELAKQFL